MTKIQNMYDNITSKSILCLKLDHLVKYGVAQEVPDTVMILLF